MKDKYKVIRPNELTTRGGQMSLREILERFIDTTLAIQGSTDDVGLIEKEEASLKFLEKNEIELNAQIKILRFLLNNNI